ncbi:hypothetical protein JV173_01530 [Acholeplasma equirhinis]|uniref:hypothetical protein n=1 Tax=Acholeplasma equirhinis TaxID=555393 RepID=UPI00197ACF00|nr:hypothetical protein [Acholeplasma equirhinis]MBN3490185.1 hypothetical protein [Acholeplasma equirhinis]
MQKPSYGWLLKWILAAILIAVGVTMFFAQSVVFMVTGMAIVIFSLFRVVPLLKTLNKEVLRTLNLVEILFDIILGGIMIWAGVDAYNTGQLDPVWGQVYKYTLVFVLVLRALVFLYSVVFLGEKTEQPKYWAHIIVLILGAMIVPIENFDHAWVAWLLLIISVLGGGYLIYDGAKGYGTYRRYSAELNQTKQVGKDKKIEKELPKTDQPVIEKDDQDRPFVS